LAKAFGSVNHAILLTKLQFYGIIGVTANWFRSYLTNRKQKIEKPSDTSQIIFSSWRTIKHGVPQGSILGPLIFIICINDLPPTLNTSSTPKIFADDTSVIICSKTLDGFCTLSNKVLSQMSKWFTANKLALDLDETNVIKFIIKIHHNIH
jgi:hypothetical protein